MMEISLDNSSSEYTIRSYQRGKIIVNTMEITDNLIITPHQLIYPWDCHDSEALVKLHPEVILLGTGEKWQIISQEQLMFFYEKNIGVEVMDTLNACKTFNVLAAEGRNVAAGLMI